MKYFFLFIIIFLAFSACNIEKKEKQDQVPEYIIPPEQMDDVLVDIHIVEGALKYKRGIGEKYKLYSNQYFDHVFMKYNISKKQFDKSLEYYYKHEKLLDEIYQSVLEQIEKIEKEKVKNNKAVKK